MSPVSPSCPGMSITLWSAARIALFTLHVDMGGKALFTLHVDMGGKALCHQFLLPVWRCQ